MDEDVEGLDFTTKIAPEGVAVELGHSSGTKTPGGGNNTSTSHRCDKVIPDTNGELTEIMRG